MNYNTFKNEVSNYNNYLKSKKELEEKIDDLIYQYSGVKGISYDKIPNISNQQQMDELKIKLSELLTEPQKELDYTILAIQRIENNLNKLPNNIKQMAELLYIDGMSLHYVGKIVGYSPSNVYRIIKKEVEKI